MSFILNRIISKLQKIWKTKIYLQPILRTGGGARSGAGRKAVPHGKAYNFRSTPEVDEILSALGSNKCKFINDAILYYSKLK